MVYTINLKKGTFEGDYEPWGALFHENGQGRVKKGVLRPKRGPRGPGGWGRAPGPPAGGPRPLPGNSCTNGLKSGL